jgi:hypothetical protein
MQWRELEGQCRKARNEALAQRRIEKQERLIAEWKEQRKRGREVPQYDPWPRAALLGTPALDWLSLGTFDREVWNIAVRCLQMYGGNRIETRRMQYTGESGEGWFYGEGVQGDYWHGLIQLSGATADHFVQEMMTTSEGRYALKHLKCSRIDVQYTHPDELPENDTTLEQTLDIIRRYLDDEENWAQQWRKPNVGMRSEGNGKGYTLYIGSRQSARMQRIYIKTINGKRLLRWEVEFKGDLAQQLWERLVSGDGSILGRVLLAEMQRIPTVEQFGIFYAALAQHEPETLRFLPDHSDAVRRVKWLNDAVKGAVKNIVEELEETDEVTQYLWTDLYRVWGEITELIAIGEHRE